MHAGNGRTSLTALIGERIWTGLKPEIRNGTTIRVAIDPRTGHPAAVDDPGAWTTHDEAQAWAATHGGAGVAIMLGPVGDTIIAGLDLHACRDPKTGEVAPWAQAVVGRFQTCTEISPSEAGIHSFFRVPLSKLAAVKSLLGGNRVRIFGANGADNHGPSIGVYGPGSYLAVTWKGLSDENDLEEIDPVELERAIRDHNPGSSDDGREARAKAHIANLKLGGATFDETREALFAAENDGATAGVAEWARANEHELERLHKEVGAQGSIVIVAGVEKRLVDLNNLNDRFALLQTRRAAAVYISRHDYMPIKEDDFRRRVANEVVQIGVDKKGKPIFEGAYNFWTGHARRHVFKHIAFTSEKLPDDTLNLFRGFGVIPRKGDCTLILNHIYEIICAKDKTAYERMLDLMAWQIQNVGKPCRIIVVLRTEDQQAGKGLLLLEVLYKIYGEDAGLIPSSTDQVLGRFNDALVGVVYVFLDEIMFHGDRKAADTLKTLATTDRYSIEPKGLPIIKVPIGVNLWMATNHPAAAYIEEKDARYWVLEPSEHRVGDHAYFAGVLKEINSGGREAFAHFLLARDVSKFVPMRDVPKNNAAKREMIKAAINPYDARKWLEECCLTRQLIGFRDYDSASMDPQLPSEKQKISASWAGWTKGKEFYFYVFSNAYTEWQKTVKSPVRPEPTHVGSLGEVLTDAGFGALRDNKSSIRILPDPDECLVKIYEPKKPKAAK
jgi:hypothetical protein